MKSSCKQWLMHNITEMHAQAVECGRIVTRRLPTAGSGWIELQVKPKLGRPAVTYRDSSGFKSVKGGITRGSASGEDCSKHEA